MRFRKRVTIAKGIYLNISSSGLSLNVGVKGASVTFGKQGTYLNTGFPGTGFSNRTLLKSSNQQYSNKSFVAPRIQHNTSTDYAPNYELIVSLNERGTPELKVLDIFKRDITDDALVNKIKKTEEYKNTVEHLVEERKVAIENATSDLVNIVKKTPYLLDDVFYTEKLKELKATELAQNEFTVPLPDIENLRRQLDFEAKEKVNEIFFWNNRTLRQKYIEDNIPIRYDALMSKWLDKKREFENIEEQRLKNHFSEIALLENIIEGKASFIEEMVDNITSEISLPASFSLNYNYTSKNKHLDIDLDLPEIEDMPLTKATTSPSGKFAVKDKRQFEINEDYARCVCGIAFFFAGKFLDISPVIKSTTISGYTQRLNKKNGHIEDAYIYSVKFTRDIFNQLNFEQIDPILAMSNFECNMDMKSDFAFREIEPI